MDVTDLLSKITFIINESSSINIRIFKESEEDMNEFIDFLKKQKSIALLDPTKLDISLKERVNFFFILMTELKDLKEKNKMFDKIEETVKTTISNLTESNNISCLTLLKNVSCYRYFENIKSKRKLKKLVENDNNNIFQLWFSENPPKEIDISFEVSIKADKSKFVSISFGFVEIIFDPFTEEKIQIVMNWMNKIPEVIDNIRFKKSPLIEEWFDITEKDLQEIWVERVADCLFILYHDGFEDEFEKKEFLYTIDIIYSSLMSLIENPEPCSNHKKSIPVIKTLSQKVSHSIDNLSNKHNN